MNRISFALFHPLTYKNGLNRAPLKNKTSLNVSLYYAASLKTYSTNATTLPNTILTGIYLKSNLWQNIPRFRTFYSHSLRVYNLAPVFASRINIPSFSYYVVRLSCFAPRRASFFTMLWRVSVRGVAWWWLRRLIAASWFYKSKCSPSGMCGLYVGSYVHHIFATYVSRRQRKG